MTKTLIWDVETSSIDILHRCYDLRVKISRFDQKDIVRDWTMLGASWKLLNGPISCISVSPKDPLNDYEVIRKLHEVLSDADILIGHNSDAFDIKKFNTRALYYDLTPIPPKRSIDTLKVAKKYFKLTSNKLAYLATYLKVDAKDESPNWNKILLGDSEELAAMREYNKKDVIVTERVYLKLRAWIDNHPNMNLANPLKDIEGNDVECCPVCQSTDFKRDGFRYTKTSKKQRFFCKSHQGYF